MNNGFTYEMVNVGMGTVSKQQALTGLGWERKNVWGTSMRRGG